MGQGVHEWTRGQPNVLTPVPFTRYGKSFEAIGKRCRLWPLVGISNEAFRMCLVRSLAIGCVQIDVCHNAILERGIVVEIRLTLLLRVTIAL